MYANINMRIRMQHIYTHITVCIYIIYSYIIIITLGAEEY